MAVQKESEIKITVGLDENRIPETIIWDASDGGVTNEEAKALMMGVWDDKDFRMSTHRSVDQRHAHG
jgi:hypothetical protein